MKKHFSKIIILPCIIIMFMACKDQFEILPNNPNVAGTNDQVPPSFLLRRILFEMSRGAGVLDGQTGNVIEEPLSLISRLNQYTSGLTFPYYGGSNRYDWTVTATPYNQIKNIGQMEKFAIQAFGEEKNGYLALGKFARAYSFIWLTQRVGDIPMLEAGIGMENLTPNFDTQKEVYAYSLQLLEEANDDLESILGDLTAPPIEGDIIYDNDLKKWQKAINSYRLRVLINLSKRADDTPDLDIKGKFAEIVNNPSKYPVFESNEDNMSFKFVPQFNRYPNQFLALYPNETTISSTFLDLTTSANDPRTFIAATPAPAEIAAGKEVSDFSAYKGSENGRPQNELNEEASNNGSYSYLNFNRYLSGPDEIPEPYIISGYSELCFNIAEAINRGWISGDAEAYYKNGINASLSFFGLEEGMILNIGNVTGSLLGTVTVSLSDFLENENIIYKGNNTEGLEQILKQKYISMWQNSGWEPFFNYRRTGIPEFSVGVGTNPQQKIPLRWQYPANEVENNAQKAHEAIQRQFGGKDDVFEAIWLLK